MVNVLVQASIISVTRMVTERRRKMSVNGISGSNSTYGMTAYEQSKAASHKTKDDTATDKKNSSGVVYESSMSESDRAALIKQLKSDTETRMNSFKNMVADMLNKQGFAVKNSDDMWKMLAKGNYTVDAATASQAKDAISENGYWGVNQTSDRMFEMAKAFSGGDSEKMEKMMDAFKKGYAQAEKMWGGKLPEISQKTYDAMFEKYEAYKAQSAE